MRFKSLKKAFRSGLNKSRVAVWQNSKSTLMMVMVLVLVSFSGCRDSGKEAGDVKGKLVKEKAKQEESGRIKAFGSENLVAWCIVPFDAGKRGPEERVKMLKRLGLKRVAYDWRQEHVATFEKEIQEYQKHGIELFAFWDQHPKAFELFEQYGLKPQIWKTAPSPAGDSQDVKVKAAAEQLKDLVEKTKNAGLQLGLYNHMGWGGEPANLVAVCEYIRREFQAEHVGIIYNFHHGHDRIEAFQKDLAMMKEYLLCLNLNGMNPGAAPKILRIGRGSHESEMIRAILKSGYSGPIGIIDHESSEDTEVVLRENLAGLESLIREIRPEMTEE